MVNPKPRGGFMILALLLAAHLHANPEPCPLESPSEEIAALLAAPKKCHITHMLKCDTKGCDIMCIDGTTCRKDGYPIEWGTTVECK